MHKYMYLYTYTHTYKYTYIYIYTGHLRYENLFYEFISERPRIYYENRKPKSCVYMYICKYKYVYIYVCTYVYIYTGHLRYENLHYEVISERPRIYFYPNFLSHDECDTIMEKGNSECFFLEGRLLYIVNIKSKSGPFRVTSCSVLQCVVVCCSMLQYVAVCCSVLQCVAVCNSVL